MKMHQKGLKSEILRFLVTGVICAIADFLTCYIVGALISFINIDWLETAIYTLCGFGVGVFCNYLLSTFWVFKNVKKDTNTKSKKFVTLFVLLSAVGWVISFLTMFGCSELLKFALQIDINNFSIGDIFNISTWISLTFWMFVLSFGLKTLLGMIWNYLTRKFILYKSPEQGDSNE
jgi:putative flippase GtrA